MKESSYNQNHTKINKCLLFFTESLLKSGEASPHTSTGLHVSNVPAIIASQRADRRAAAASHKSENKLFSFHQIQLPIITTFILYNQIIDNVINIIAIHGACVTQRERYRRSGKFPLDC